MEAERGLREESERGDHRADQERDRALAETLEAGRGSTPGELFHREAVRGREQPVFDEQADLREPGGQPVGDLQPDPGSGRTGPQGRERNEGTFFKDRTPRAARDENGEIRKNPDGKTIYQEEARPVYCQYTVFNVEQAEGLKLEKRGEETRPEWEVHREAERVLKANGAEIEHVPVGDRAYYRMEEDKIVLPEPGQFESRTGYYQTALHEAGHATGHATRMNRESLHEGIEKGFGSPEYAREELRAEISAMMTGEQVGVGHDPQRGAAYVENWIQVLEEDPFEIQRAARDAGQMTEYLRERAIAQERKQPTKTQAELTHEYSHERGPQIGHTPKRPVPDRAQAQERDVGPSR